MTKIEFILFIAFLCIALAFIGLGFYRLEHTELSLIGFFFIFLLGMVVLGNNLTYQTGEVLQVNNSYSLINGSYELDSFTQTKSYTYSTYEDDSGFFTTHNFGYLLVVLSAIGMIGSFVSIRKEGFFK